MSQVIFTLVTLCTLPVSFVPMAARPPALSVLFAFMQKPGWFMPHYDFENGANYEAWRREHQSEIGEIER